MGTYRKSNIVGQVVTSFTVDDAAITAAKLAAGAVTSAKLSLACRNESGGTLTAGTLVYVSGWSETQSKFLISKADSDAASKPATWILQADLANNTNGTAYKRHRLTSVDTSGTSVGDPIYLDSTAGGWTKTAPTAANARKQVVGFVAVVHATTGEIEFDLLSSFSADVIGSNELAALSVVTAAIAANAVTQAKIAANALDGTVAANVADVNVIGGLPVLHRIAVPAGVTGDVDVTLTHKTRVTEVWLVKKTAAGGGAGTIQVKNGANAITDAMSINVNDQTVVRAATIDDAQWEIAAAGTLRVTRTRTASTDESCEVYVLGLRVA